MQCMLRGSFKTRGGQAASGQPGRVRPGRTEIQVDEAVAEFEWARTRECVFGHGTRPRRAAGSELSLSRTRKIIYLPGIVDINIEELLQNSGSAVDAA